MYKEKLIALLEGLEVQKIEMLIKGPPAMLKTVGAEIAKSAKMGANLYRASQPKNSADKLSTGMKNKTCPECGREIKKHWFNCPQCGWRPQS